MSIPNRSVYPTQPDALAQTLNDLLAEVEIEPINGDILALIVPDTNLLDLAPVAAKAYKHVADRADLYDTVTIIAPSHGGVFDRLAVCPLDNYRTPIGEVPVNDRVRNELCDEDDDIFLDHRGHYHTEGVDVQLPYFQNMWGESFSVVPIVMGRESPAFCHELGTAVGEVMYGQRMLLVASADLLSVEEGALERFTEALETFDTSSLMHLLGSEQIRVEGMGSVITAVIAAQRRGATHARLVDLREPSDDVPGAMACVLWRE